MIAGAFIVEDCSVPTVKGSFVRNFQWLSINATVNFLCLLLVFYWKGNFFLGLLPQFPPFRADCFSVLLILPKFRQLNNEFGFICPVGFRKRLIQFLLRIVRMIALILEMPSMGNYNCFQIFAQTFDTNEFSDQERKVFILRRYTFSRWTFN